MTTDEAARILRRMYTNAPTGERVAHIHLFGIQYDHDLHRLNIPEILKAAELPDSYKTEIHKGRKLAKYVELKKP
jgi:hypothetical protein